MASAVTPASIGRARVLAHKIGLSRPDAPRPCVIPTVCGGVCLEWWHPARALSFEIECGEADQVYYCDDDEDLEWEGTPESAPVHPMAFLGGRQWEKEPA